MRSGNGRRGMTGANASADSRRVSYVSLCEALARFGRVIGLGPGKALAKARRDRAARKGQLDALATQLELGAVRCEPQIVVSAAWALAAIAAMAGAAASVVSVLHFDATAQLAVLLMTVLAPLMCYKYVIGYPASAARRRGSAMLKSSSDAISLMVMGVRQDASLPKAIEFASAGDSEFSEELRRCTWEVITGTYSSFEEAVHALGGRWERFSSELKTALSAVVVASREGTEEGKRRALERANRAMVAGAKRRVEEYALSLSAPSMLLFGLGILLPIMVGSFMPMLSWDIWTAVDGQAPPADGRILETAIVMDLVFPLVALAVAVDAVSRRPVDRREPGDPGRGAGWHVWAAALLVGAACSASAHHMLAGGSWAPFVLLAGAGPASAVLMIVGARGGSRAGAGEEEVQDLLFRLGAKMLDGDNFESALNASAQSSASSGEGLGRRLCLRAFVMGKGLEGAVGSESAGGRANALEALKVVWRASAKDEADAGMMAMDIAAYLRELSGIESTLKMRLRPTISMMRMTAHLLGPLVLGVTFAIYVSLGSVAGGYGDSSEPEAMLAVLGLFLAEMNAVVCYFVWGIDGRSDTRRLARSTGVCMLVSQLVLASTAIVSA